MSCSYLQDNRREEGSHAASIVGLKGHVPEEPMILRGFSNDLDELLVIDFDEGETLGAVGIFQAKGFFATKIVSLVIASFVWIAHVIGHMSYPDNVRLLYDGHEQKCCHKQQRQKFGSDHSLTSSRYSTGVAGLSKLAGRGF
jgi:hypothetical protein